MYYKTCPECGASLDPDELCDCQDPLEEDKDEDKEPDDILKEVSHVRNNDRIKSA